MRICYALFAVNYAEINHETTRRINILWLVDSRH